MDELYGWLFHYNIYQKKWYAFKREDSKQYFNGELKNILHSEDVNDLIKYVTMGKHEKEKQK